MTSQTSGLTITGTAEANARVELFNGTTSLGTVTADSSGNFSLDVVLAAGINAITAKATDAAGNVGGASSQLSITVDTAAPAAPTGLDLASADDTGSSNSDNVTSQTSGLTITGTAEANARVELFNGTTSLGTVTADSSGNFSLDVTLDAGDRSVTAIATDAAGNVGDASAALVVTVDVTPPAAILLEVNRTAQTLTIRFDEGIDLAGPLPASAFLVTMGSGVANSVTNVAVNESNVVLTLADALVSGNTVLTYTDPSSGNDAVAIQDAAGNDTASFTLSLGVVADGFVRGARIFVENIVDGQVVRADTGVVTDAQGNFFLPPDFSGRTIVAVGGLNIDTGIANTVDYRAPAGSTVINPLTTLIQAVVDASPTPITSAAASQSVATALGIVLPDGKLLSNYDPISFGNADVQRVAAQVAAIVTVADGGLAGDEGKVFANVAAQLVTAAGANSTVDLTSSQFLTDALAGTNAVDDAGAVSEIQSSVTAIQNAVSIAEISQAQSATLDKVAAAKPGQIDLRSADDTGASNSDNITSKQNFSVTITFDSTSTDGTAVVVGDTVEVVVDGQVIGSRVVTDADLAEGLVTVAFENVQDGAYSASARIVDRAGNISEISATLDITVDSTKPATPTLSFANLIDTGSNENAPVTTDKSFDIELSGAEIGAIVVYELSTDGGENWTETSVNQSNLADGSYQFRANVTDVAGNSVFSNIVSMTVDTANPSVPTVIAESSTSTTPVVSGAAVIGEGETLSVSINGAIYENVAVINGAWSVDTAAATPKTGTTLGELVSGTYEVVATIVDRAGNASTDSSTQELTITPTFSISESDGVVSFAGTATGIVSITYNTDGEAVFSRSGVSAAATVANLGTKSIAGAIELSIDITGIATAGDDIITISAAEATVIRFIGDAGSGLDQLIVKVADKNPGIQDDRVLLLNTSGVSNAENIRFVFDATAANLADALNADNDTLTLAVGSVISSGFTTIEVRTGVVDFSAAFLPENVRFDFRSGGISTLGQFQSAKSFTSLTDSGSVVIALTEAELNDLEAFLSSPGALKLIGFTVGLKVDGGSIIDLSTTADQAYAGIRAALDAISFPGIVGLTSAVNDLQDQIDANDIDIAALVLRATDLEAAITLLEGDATVTGSVLSDIKAALGTLPTYDTLTNTFGTDGSGVYQAVADAIDQNIAALKLAIEGNGLSAGSFDTIVEIQAALVLLEGADSVTGSVLSDIKAALGTLPTYDTLTNTFGTDGSGVYQAVADAIDQNIAALKLAIEGNGLSAGSFDTIVEIQAALVLLEGADSVTGSVLSDIKAALGTLPTYDTSTNTFGTDGSGVYQAVADAIDQNIAALKLAIEGNGLSAGSFDTIVEIQAALVLLEGADSVTGSVLSDIKAALGTLPAYDASTNTFGTDGSAAFTRRLPMRLTPRLRS
ncbi:MAG: beta strand repeat-containing protein [Polymorphobacter sp.]|uniref:beta strand repeat-containing protein n=1 Tax=Polymorphobacter sp. TaxID=1909290 RepID=UPI003A8601D0